MASTKKPRRRRNPVPRFDPKSGPPVYFATEPTTIPEERIEEAVYKVLAARGALHPKGLARLRKLQS